EAHSGYEQCLNRMSERTEAALAPLDAQVREACAKEEFRRALDLLDAARKPGDSSGWNQALEKRSRKTREVASKLLDELKEKARAAAGRKDQPEIALLRSRLIPWGDPEWLASFDATLVAAAPGAAPPPGPNAPAPGPSPAGATPLPASWLRAISLATARDYRAAAEELRPTRSARPPGATAEPEIEKDLDDLRIVSVYVQESQETLSKWPRGQKISLEFRNENGSIEKILDSFLRVEGGRIELKRNEGSRLIPLGEITAASLVHLEISRNQNPKERARAAMLLYLLEGDPEGARALGGDVSSIPQKYWTYAQSVLEADGGGDPESARKEQEARHAFFQAEAGYGDPRRGIEAVGLYKSLLEVHGETRFVRRNRAAIAARTGPLKEYLFPSTELSGAGAFQWVSPSKGRACWISQKDGDPAKAQQNYVEAAFSAFPDVEYRCWAYVGGCCAETFECFYQATDLSGPPPKNSKDPVSLEPGSSLFAPIKHSISSLKRTHAQHGGPKMPLRWEWVTLLLPKFTAPGLKSIRLLSSQQGFAVSCVLVSAVRQSPLREAELKDLEKATSERSGASPGLAQNASQDPSLLGYWAFDEKAGGVASDSTRNHNHGSLQNGAAWASGKVGGGLSLDGNAAFVRVPPSPTLTGLRDQLTVAAWVFRKSDQNGWRFVLTKPKQPETDEEFWLGFFENRPSFGVDTPSGNKELLGPTAVPLNQWIHLAGTYDGKMLKVFVNGSMLAQEPCAAPLRISSQPLSIGARINVKTEAAGFAFSGLIDEVRLYNRALSAQDVATLAATSTEQHRAAPH
ncbi:MAG TPA: LamG domain-containing protein, partial [Planctomycetota bacterium]|nr:LamG domain-containing protein [Planctomycetota bacterium]